MSGGVTEDGVSYGVRSSARRTDCEHSAANCHQFIQGLTGRGICLFRTDLQPHPQPPPNKDQSSTKKEKAPPKKPMWRTPARPRPPCPSLISKNTVRRKDGTDPTSICSPSSLNQGGPIGLERTSASLCLAISCSSVLLLSLCFFYFRIIPSIISISSS